MYSRLEKIDNRYTRHEIPKLAPFSWFPIIFTIFTNILCFIGIIGNILCNKIIKQENRLSSLNNDRSKSKSSMNFRKTRTNNAFRHNKANIEEINLIIYRTIAVANILLLGIFYLFQMISFAEHVYFKEIAEILIENELDQFGRWTNEILASCQDSIQSYILMLFLIIILNHYFAVFEPWGRKLFCANRKLIKLYF